MKRRQIFAFVLVFVMLVSAMPIFSSAASALDGKTIVCFGDSLTEGTYYWETNGYPVYSDYLADAFSGSTVINAGARGDSTYNAILRYEKDVIAKNPDIVIMCFGMNDQAWEVQYNRPIQTLDRYVSQLTTMITDIQESGADVVLVTPNPVYEAAYTPTAYNNYEYGLMPQYCDAMRELAIELGCGLVDINYEITEKGISTYVSSDGIHQTTAGHQLYADCIGAYLKAAYDGINKATATVKYMTSKGNKLGSFEFVGAAGAKITLPTPALEEHSAVSDDIKTTLTNGAEYEFVYLSPLESYVDHAYGERAYGYSKSVIDEVRALCARADEMLSPDNETYTVDDMVKLSLKLKTALLANGEGSAIKSMSASYDTTAPNYYFQGNDTRYFDDNIRLTDGVKGALNGDNTGGNNYYSAWSGDAEVTVDLGEAIVTNAYNAYVATSTAWNIQLPSLEISYSNDGVSFTKLDCSCNSSVFGSESGWEIYRLSVESETDISARYIRYTFDARNFVWVNEVEALCNVSPIENIAYIDGFDSPLFATDTRIFTSDFGDFENARWNYAAILVAEWNDSLDAYIVTEVFEGSATNTDRALEENEILVAVNDNGSEWSSAAYDIISGAKVGQKLSLDGIDVENRTVLPLSYVYLEDCIPLKKGDVNQDGVIDMFDYLLVKSFYFEVAVPTADEALRADMNEDGVIDMFDYLEVKTAYFNS